jgi:porin
VERPFVLGDFGGARTALSKSGWLILSDYTQFCESVVSDGINDDLQYGAKTDTQFIWDAARAGVVPGGVFILRLETRYGESTNTTSGLLSPTNSAMFIPITPDNPDDDVAAITDLYWIQSISPNVALIAGKLQGYDSDLNEFASGRGVQQFQNFRHTINNALIVAGPYDALAAGAVVTPSETSWGYVLVEQYGDASTTSGFDNFDSGWVIGTEWYKQYRLGHLPGGFNLGYIYAGDADLINFSGKVVDVPGVGLVPQPAASTWGTWFGVWQYLNVAEEIGSRPIALLNHQQDVKGIGVWARVGIADEETCPYPFAFSAGLGGKGSLPGRDQDTWGIAYSFLDVEPASLAIAEGFSPRQRSHAFESYYNMSLTPGINLTFNLQVTEAPLKDFGTPFVLGTRLNTTF